VKPALIPTVAPVLLTVLLVVSGAGAAVEAWSSAIERNDCARISALLDAGEKPERPSVRGKTALMAAAGGACRALVRRLLELGVSVDATNPRHGTALMYAVIGGDPWIVAELLRAGADPDRQGANGWGAVMIAAAKGRAEILDQLLEAGADPNLRDLFGWTPLMRAAYEGRRTAVERLLADPRVDVNARDYNGATALHHVGAKGERRMWDLLLKAGADPSIRDLAGNLPVLTAGENERAQTRP
jgi:ankyrin repeat protein